MKKMIHLLCAVAAVMLMAGMTVSARAEAREILLPDGIHYLRIPEEMSWQEPALEDTDLEEIWLMPPELEMLVFAYDVQNASVRTLAETLVNAGQQAEVRQISGMDFLVFQDRDEADGAPCVGYSYISGGKMVEISFFYGSQAAADLTKTIMESFHE